MDLDAIKATASAAVRPLKQPRDWPDADWMSCTRTKAGEDLPESHLVFAFLVDLLGFKSLRRFEKVLWSIPVELNDTIFFIEHRKFGLGVFGRNVPLAEETAREIVQIINQGIRSLEKSGYFECWTRMRSRNDNVILINDCGLLYERFDFFRQLFQRKWNDIEAFNVHDILGTTEDFVKSIERYSHCANLREEAAWLGQAAIDCFFSWTEHVFVHLAILLGNQKVNSEDKCNKLITNGKWVEKYRAVFDFERDSQAREFCDSLTNIRELRNFATHGHFGKGRETLWTPTSIGCVPYNVYLAKAKNPWRHNPSVGVTEHNSLQTIEKFIDYLWSDARQPARIILQESCHPTFLKFMRSGEYAKAMESEEGMKSLVRCIHNKLDIDENMDF